MHRVVVAPMDKSISGVLLAKGNDLTVVLRDTLDAGCTEDVVDLLLADYARGPESWDDEQRGVG